MDPFVIAALGAAGVVVAVLIATAASEDYRVTFRRTMLIALCMILLVLLVNLALDMRELRTNLPHAPKLFVLKESNQLIAAFVANGTNEVHPMADMSPIREGAQRAGIAGVHNESFYRTFFVGKTATDDVTSAYASSNTQEAYDERPLSLSASIVTGNEPIELLNLSIPRDTAVAYLYMQEPGASFIDWYLRQKEIPAEYRSMVDAQFRAVVPTDDYFRSVVFAKLAEKRLKGTRWLITYRYGQMEVYPNSIMFQLIDIMPYWFTNVILPEE